MRVFMTKPKVHVLYEYGVNFRPHASSSLRLIRPLSYPAVQKHVSVSFGYEIGGAAPDLVIVDRLWKPDITVQAAQDLAAETHRRGAKLIYSLDDNFLAIDDERPMAANFKQSFLTFLEASDGLLVSTPELKKAFPNKERVIVLPSALDERIIVQKGWKNSDPHKTVIGYMGTTTHDDDLHMILPAFHEIHARYPGRLRFEFIGALDQARLESWEELKNLPIRILQPLPYECEYPLFMLWFTGAVRWDIAVAPLIVKPLNRFKSDIKYLDYTAAGVPGIFSSLPAYANTIVDRGTGRLVENDPSVWTAALLELIEDAPLRESLYHQAADYLYQQRILAQCSDNWLQSIRQMMDW